MAPTRTPLRARIAAAAGLAALAAAVVAFGPKAPDDLGLALLGRVLLRLAPGFEWAFLLILGLGSVLVIGITLAAIRDYFRHRTLRKGSLLATLLAYLATTAFLLYMRHHGSPRPTPPAPIVRAQAPQAPASPVPQAPVAPPPAQDDTLLALAAAAALVAGAAGTWLLLRREKEQEREPSEDRESRVFASARHRLERGDRVRDAIIACYDEMCGLFDGAPAGLTAREFAALLRRRGAGEPEIQALTATFEKARYSLEPCGEDDRAQALEALGVLEARHQRREGRP